MDTTALSGASGGNASGLPIGRGFPWLAPLAGYSDLPFRLLCREMGAAVACTEMVSAKGLVLGQGKRSNVTAELLASVPPLPIPQTPQFEGCTPLVPDRPLVVQLFGAEAPFLAEAVRILTEWGCSWFDLNMGCSVPKVIKSGSGAAMLSDCDNAVTVARAMIRAAGTGRVGFKLRLGRQPGEETYRDLAKRLEDEGAAWITLHPRYAKHKFTGVADWEAVASLVESLAIPVMVSGDLFTAADGIRALGITGAAGVMFARGAMNNPAIFREFLSLAHEGTQPPLPEPETTELEQVVRRHMALIRSFYPVRPNRQGIEAGLLKMRTFVPRYVKHCAGARHLRRGMATCANWAEMEDLLAAFFSDAAMTHVCIEEEGICR